MSAETQNWPNPYRLQFYNRSAGGVVEYDYFDLPGIAEAYNQGRLQANDMLESFTEGQSESVGSIIRRLDNGELKLTAPQPILENEQQQKPKKGKG